MYSRTEEEKGDEDAFSLGCLLMLSPGCCQGIQLSRRGGGVKAAGVERHDDSSEMTRKSCVSLADAFHEITVFILYSKKS